MPPTSYSSFHVNRHLQGISTYATPGQTLKGRFSLNYANRFVSRWLPHDATAQQVKEALEVCVRRTSGARRMTTRLITCSPLVCAFVGGPEWM